MVGRRPLPDGQARTEKLYTKVTPAGKHAFYLKCARLNITPAEGLRRAVAAWTGAAK